MESVPFKFPDLVDRVGQLLSGKAAEKKIELITRYEPSAPKRFIGDPTRLQQVLTNIVGNAIKFTSEGHVLLDVNCEAQTENQATLKVQVTDTGIGISNKAQKNIFSRFQQADNSTTRHFGGTGLGLSISSQLIDMMGGTLNVKSKTDKGSTFFFSIPLTRDKSKTNTEEINESTLPINLTEKWTLIVDDNEPSRLIILEYLSSWDIPCGIAASAREALQMMRAAASRKQPFDTAIIDLHMSGMNGIELANAITNNDQLKETKLILMSSESLTGMNIENIPVKLTKPIRAFELHNAMESLYRQPRSHDSKAQKENKSISFNAEILLVEDNRVNQKVAMAIIRKLGCHVDIAENGKVALEKLSRKSYDMIFMDCQMPVLDGYEATRRIRESEGEEEHIPVIAMTANAMQGDREKCLKAGMDEYIPKPIKRAAICSILEHFLKCNTISGQNQ